MEHSRKRKLTDRGRKQPSGVLGVLGARRSHKGAQENFWRMVAEFAVRMAVMDRGFYTYAKTHQTVSSTQRQLLYVRDLNTLETVAARPLAGCVTSGGSPCFSKPHSRPWGSDSGGLTGW